MILSSVKNFKLFKYLTNILPATNELNSILQCRKYGNYPKIDFNEICKESVKPPEIQVSKTTDGKIISISISAIVDNVATPYAAKSAIVEMIVSLSDSKDVATSKTEANLSYIPENTIQIIKWKGKPIFIYHRSQTLIDNERSVNIADLRDPETDESRSKKPEWMILLGVCTHYGCILTPNSSVVPGGFFCQCYGSHFDSAGRIRLGPAPKNLDVPPYTFIDDYNIVIG